MICAIGWEVLFGQQFRRYTDFISLNVRMLPLCHRYVIIYAYYTQIMLLQRSSVTLFHAYQSIFLSPQRRGKILAIGWEVRFGHHFRRSREFTSINFCMLLLCYHYVIIYAFFTRVMFRQISL